MKSGRISSLPFSAAQRLLAIEYFLPHLGGFHYALTKCGVWVNGIAKIVCISIQLDGQSGFGDGSEALGPTMVMPSTRSSRSSSTTLMNPSVVLVVIADQRRQRHLPVLVLAVAVFLKPSSGDFGS